ncbi:MAG TPA: hypothetical protein DCX00_09135 [Flavobacteriales bacterium]|nr:hypothetical protein [Flavobacteriales bacterium]
MRFFFEYSNMKYTPFYLFIAAIFLGGCAKTEHEHDHPEPNQYQPPAAHEMIISAAEWGVSDTHVADVPFITQDLVDNAIIMMYVYQGDATDTAPYSDYWGPVPSPYHNIAYFDYDVGGLWLECEDDTGIFYDHLIRLVPIPHRDYAELDEMDILNDMDAVLDFTQK